MRDFMSVEYVIRLEDPRHDEVIRMLSALDAYLESLYPPQSNHLLDVESLCAPNIRFFVARRGVDPVGCGALRVEAGYGEVKRMFVVPAAREPRAVVDQPQRAQRLEQGQLAPLERHEVLVARKQVGELPRHRAPLAREQHPEILQRRAHARVVEIDEVRTALGPQDVSRVAIAVQPDRAKLAGALVASCDRR